MKKFLERQKVSNLTESKIDNLNRLISTTETLFVI